MCRPHPAACVRWFVASVRKAVSLTSTHPAVQLYNPPTRWCHNKTGRMHNGQSKPRRAARSDSEGRSIDLTPRDASQRDAGLGGLSVSCPGYNLLPYRALTMTATLWTCLSAYMPLFPCAGFQALLTPAYSLAHPLWFVSCLEGLKTFCW